MPNPDTIRLRTRSATTAPSAPGTRTGFYWACPAPRSAISRDPSQRWKSSLKAYKTVREAKESSRNYILPVLQHRAAP